MEVKIKINGKEILTEQGKTILKTAEENGIEIPTLCHDESVKNYGGCGMCVVEVEGTPKLLRACSTAVADGMVINTMSERVVKARKIALELILSDHEGDCVAPCTLNCPAQTACNEYVKQIALGNNFEAVKIIKEKIPLPSSIGRICPHPCETACRRKLAEEPISICRLKAYAADADRKSQNRYVPVPEDSTGKKIAVIGGGPGGLTAAYYLRLKGHSVTVFDAMPKMGGMLRYGIPEYRLPKNILDDEINQIADLGIEFKNNIRVGVNITLDEIRAEFDAVIAAIGAWNSTPLKCDGEEGAVINGIEFLRSVAEKNPINIGNKVAVVGGGNTAMDVCRTAVRMGCEKVYVVYRRTRAEMPAEDVEIEEAIEEGVEFKFLTTPVKLIGANNKIVEAKLQIMKLGEPDSSGRRRPVPVEGEFEYIKVDSVIAALGQQINSFGFDQLEKTERGNISADENTFATSLDGVFAIGDAVNRGASIAIEAIASGKKVAQSVDDFLNGRVTEYKKPFLSERNLSEKDFADEPKKPRAKVCKRPAEERIKDFKEVEQPLSPEDAVKEAQRCLECGCHDYGKCRLIKYANQYPVEPKRFSGEKHPDFTENRLEIIERNQGKCILCGLCVRVCNEVAEKGILGFVGRGFNTVIKPEFQNPETVKICSQCKKCAECCPTGALKILK